MDPVPILVFWKNVSGPIIFLKKEKRPRVGGRSGLLRLVTGANFSPALFAIASTTRSRLRLPGFWRGGNSRKICSHRPGQVPACALP
jgi:hypothetical protein